MTMRNWAHGTSALAIVGLFILSGLLIGGCVDDGPPPALQGEPRAMAVHAALTGRVNAMEAGLDRFAAAIEASDGGPASQAAVQAAFEDARHAFKEAEGLIAYLFPGTMALLNKPALPHIEDHDPNAVLRPPQGYQVLEEMIYPVHDASVQGKKDLRAELHYTRAAVRRARAHTASVALKDRHVFEAARLSLIRLQSLGLAGFDSPVALRSLDEGAVVLDALRADLAPFRRDAEARAPEAWAALDRTLAEAAAHLRSDAHTFEAFDRLHFTRAFANPLMANLHRLRGALGIAGNPVRTAVRPGATSLWDADAFDPAYFAAMGSGAPTPERVALGELLFFDPVLSGNGQRACASCHQPERAFTDGRTVSVGFDFAPGPLRNAPTILNAGLQASTAYDQATESVEQRVDVVLRNPHEMASTPEAAVEALRRSPEYVERFAAAFGTGAADPASDPAAAVTERHLRVALADYVRSFSRLDTPFDRYARGETDALAESVQRGFNLFMGKALCGTCHFAPLFNGSVPPAYTEHEAEILGVPAQPDTAGAVVSPDLGKHALFGYDLHAHAFKTPTVRGAALTAPYMHNGVYRTLEEVVDFYNRGGGAGIGIDLEFQTLPPDPLDLTAAEVADLVAFMEALTDTTGTTRRPAHLPAFPEDPALSARPVGGAY